MQHRTVSRGKGFTLVEMAIVLVFMGLVAGLYFKLRAAGGETGCIRETKASLEKIHDALTHFQETNERLPRPALRQLGVNDPKFGREADSKDLDHYVADFVDVSFGALPFQALGLPASYAGDCWQNKFTYVVTTDLTDSNKFRSVPPAPYYEGQLEVADSNNPGVAAKASQLAYVVISHGANGKGAVALNYTGKESQFIKKATSALESGNYDIGDVRLIEAPMKPGAEGSDAAFDDLLTYNGRPHTQINGKCRFTHVAGDYGKCAQGMPSTEIIPDCVATPHRDTWSCLGVFGGTSDTGCYSTRTAPCPGGKGKKDGH